MSKSKFHEAYRKFYSDRDNEQLELFRLLAGQFEISRVLYPGCYVHVTPSFVFPIVTYVDNDRQTKAIFAKEEVIPFVNEKREYECDPEIVFHPQSYTETLDESRQSYDLLISLYAGFISVHCKKYLKRGGLLLVNNSHGDAGVAFIDAEFELVGVINRRKARYALSRRSLDKYFIPKKPQEISKETLIKLGRGIGYTRTAGLYLFMKM